MSACTCVCCELGTPEDCIACRTCGSSWCDWFGEHPAEHSNDEEEPMSDDRFADCRTPEDVLAMPAEVLAYCETQAAVSWRDGMTADEAHGRNAVAEEVLRIAAGVTMPAPKSPPLKRERCPKGTSVGEPAELADAVIRELSELHVPQRIMLSHASQDAERRRLDAASWLEKELAAAGLKCGAGWVLYNLVDGVIARLNGVAE